MKPPAPILGKLDKVQFVKETARARIGEPKGKTVIRSKKDKEKGRKGKYPADLSDVNLF
jgi:hypothetical protein